MTENFFLVLPSNTKSSIHRNTSSHFVINLPKPLNLIGQWEVCLHEISFVNSFNNIHDRINNVIFTGYKNDPLLEQKVESLTEVFDLKRDSYPALKNRFRTAHTKVPPGRYMRVEDIVDAINMIKPKWFASKIKLEKVGLKKVRFELNSFANSITFHPVLAQIMGLKNNHFAFGMEETDLEYSTDTIKKHIVGEEDMGAWEMDQTDILKHYSIVTGTHQPDIRACFYNIYVYTNIVKDTIVGNSYVPLLRTVQNTTPKNAYVTESFLHNNYIPIKTNYISSITIYLTDDTGSQVEFKFGKTIATLHFRKKDSL